MLLCMMVTLVPSAVSLKVELPSPLRPPGEGEDVFSLLCPLVETSLPPLQREFRFLFLLPRVLSLEVRPTRTHVVFLFQPSTFVALRLSPPFLMNSVTTL